MPINERNVSNFKDELRDTLKDAEKFEKDLYYDTNKIATIGCGFNVTLKDILQKVCDEIYSEPKMDEKEFAGLLNTINGVEVKTNGNLRSKVSEYLDGIKTEDKKSAKFAKFELNDKQIGDILPEVVEIFRDGLNKKLAYTSISQQESKIDDKTKGSSEYIALMSMTYNNPSLVGNGLKAHLRAKNRFGAWYEIRYKSNGDNEIGIAKRRFVESNKFGLFESNANNNAVKQNTLTNISINAISFEECLDLFSLLNVAKIKDKDEPSITYLQNAIAYETTKEFKGNRTIAGYSRGNADFNTHYRKYNTILQFFADKINALLKDVTKKSFKLEDIYVITTKGDNSHNISRINKLLKIRAENGEFRPEAKRDILLIYPTASALPVMPIQPKNTTFTIVLADNTSLDCSNLNPNGNSSESEIVLMDYKQDVREPNKNSRDEEISFIKPSTNGETIIYKNANGIFISQDKRYAFNSGNVITLNFFEKMNFNLLNFAKENSYSIRSDKASSMFDIKLRLPDATDSISTKNEGNFNLVVSDLIIEDEEGKSFDIKEVYLHNGEDKRVYPSYYLKKNDDKDADSNSSSNSSSKNSYTAKFRININLDKNSSGYKKTSKFIIATFDLSKRYDTGEIHAKEDTAVVTLASKDKKDGGAEFDIKVSTVVYQKNITEIRLNTSESSDATNLSIKDTLNLEAVYLPNKGDDDYKEVNWAYKVIREDKYNSEVVGKVAGAINLSEEKFKGKKITFSPKDDIKDKELLKKLNHGNHIIMFFAYLKSPAFNTNFGKTHIRVDIKAPIYLKYSNGKLCIYEFEHTDATMCFDTSLSDDIFGKEGKDEKVEHMPKGVYYINSNLNSGDIDIYEDDKLSETCYQSIDGKDRSYIEPCKIYAIDSNIQRASSIKSGINLINSENKNRFIQKFNEVKQRVGLDSKEVKLEVG